MGSRVADASLEGTYKRSVPDDAGSRRSAKV